MVKKIKNLKYYAGLGRRKEAVAQVRLYLPAKDRLVDIDGLKIKTGEIFVNKKPVGSLFTSSWDKNRYLAPLKLTQSEDRFAISAIIKGGGKTGQLEALVCGIARALEKVDRQNFRLILKQQGFLTRDARSRERRKVGMGGKARREKQSPKR